MHCKTPPSVVTSIYGRIIERLIFNEMSIFFIENDPNLSNQSGFKPGDSCVIQIVSNTPEIHKSFDEGHEVKGVFLDILKALDKVWHDVITFKLTQNGISGNLLKLLCDILSERRQYL